MKRARREVHKLIEQLSVDFDFVAPRWLHMQGRGARGYRARIIGRAAKEALARRQCRTAARRGGTAAPIVQWVNEVAATRFLEREDVSHRNVVGDIKPRVVDDKDI